MFIREIFEKKKTVMSFEIFPPKSDLNTSNIDKTIKGLRELNADFISVTYGAGGSNRGKSTQLASIIKNKYGVEVLQHLTCITSTKEEMNNILDHLNNNNIENVLALTGDLPKVYENFNSDYKYSKDLIRAINKKNNFCVAAAIYPEGHRKSRGIKEDMMYLKDKVDEGADFLMTQLFFDNNAFYNFRELMYKYNIRVPVIAGILPAVNKKVLNNIINLTGTEVSNGIKNILEKHENNEAYFKEAGIYYAGEQINDLIDNGTEGIHLYTMNNLDVTQKVLHHVKYIR